MALCTRLNDTSDVVSIVIKLLIEISHVKRDTFYSTIMMDDMLFVPQIVSLLSHDTVSIRKDVMWLIEAFFSTILDLLDAVDEACSFPIFPCCYI